MPGHLPALQRRFRDIAFSSGLCVLQKDNAGFTCSQELQATWHELHTAAPVHLDCTSSHGCAA